ncbi:SRPBCC family protein [Sinimarinibacterium sp. CAU 1509]|nr:SRPBCC family protein [Sinimarinibacterium sp. CAU 1509]
MPAQTLSVGIACAPATAYAYLAQPENFAQWASGLADTLECVDGQWHAQTPAGPARLHFSAPNDWGVADHTIEFSGDGRVYVPLRVVANASGSEVCLTLFKQPLMSDADFARDIGWVQRDLQTLKTVLEAH